MLERVLNLCVCFTRTQPREQGSSSSSASRVDTLSSGMTKLSMGSAGVMERTEVRGIMDPTYGARAAG